MTKPNLSDIYRNGTRRAETDSLDADAILWLADGSATDAQLDRVAASALHADLIHFARDLENESVALSASVEGLLRADSAAHRRAMPARRMANGRRGWRIASAIAASFVAAVVFWNAGRMQPRQSTQTMASSDRIFAGFEERQLAQQQTREDRIFNGAFHSDEIFNSRTGG
jgi:anti-sigma-K factor RskA